MIFLHKLLASVTPLLKLLCLAMIGLVISHPKTQIIPRATFKILSKLVFALFLPCLIFTHLGGSMTLENFSDWWFVPVNVVISTIIGCLLGYIVTIICRPPPQFIRLTIIMTAFGNTGNLSIAIIGSVCHNRNNPFGPDCKDDGMTYIAFAQWVSVILVYTLVYHMMEPPLQSYNVVPKEETEFEKEEEGVLVSDASRPLLFHAEWPGIENQETWTSKRPFIARIFNSITSASQTVLPDFEEVSEPSSPKGTIGCLAEPKVVRKIRTVAEETPIRHILQPPTIASLLAIIVGIIPQLKAVFFGYDAPFSFLVDSLKILAGAMVPSVMLILGGMLGEGPNDSKLGMKTTIGITVARLLVSPLVGIGVVALAGKMNILVHGDHMFKFVLLLQYATPSAILLGAIASLRGYGVAEASALLFWQHIFALFSLSLYIVVYFKLLPQL